MKPHYSNVYKQSLYQCQFSPSNEYVAHAVDNRLVIRYNDIDLTIIHVYECPFVIEYVQWSPDSKYILIASPSKAIVHVLSISDTIWRAIFEDHYHGIQRVTWRSDSGGIITAAHGQFQLKMWSLTSKDVLVIKGAKFANKGYMSSPDGKYFAVLETKQGKDHLSIYTPRWTLVKHFKIDTADASNIQWSPNSSYLAVWDNSLYYKILVYRPDGHLYTSYQAPEDGLGIKTVAWNSRSSILAMGGYDHQIRFMTTSDWKVVIRLSHPSTIHQNTVDIYEENSLDQKSLKRPLPLPMTRPDYNIANPSTGIGAFQFSPDGRLFYSIDDSMPTTLWLWNARTLKTEMIVCQLNPIRQVVWHPAVSKLFLVSGEDRLSVVEYSSGQWDITVITVPTGQESSMEQTSGTCVVDGYTLVLFNEFVFERTGKIIQ
ncbi:hypothetical protein J3Q64DRAFT_1695420 [Phycomyces blakesleeanus]|uniref:Anaphase-promoting complex subunit 4 WD40 domain-containing protein n=2 Tax=Phycomyces blakesleeanus TaxID=4837 RepID=A0A163AYY5_PHYB8|nr:hypothetical protein PHYBLDRAFT_63132 [Phycomyces blakesleeanus NRRL 1555(-)]OAD76661.1 hypothetical protein PHYBLDRAFT_63132 [Phycomyces blakesleeanus NRRL 1555(-)]|eukprot:XP_018294701.1 hypothetical protein PHYBLDRAFT_63132 [Phycomyces blakesleeanus NRRL 1555(-)]